MLKLLLTALTIPMLTGAAIAADAPATGRPAWNPQAMEQMRAEREARRADDMALLIGLRPDQRPALDSFLTTVRPPHGDRSMGDRKPGAGQTPGAADPGTLARLDAASTRLDQRDAEAKHRIEATRTFYASLSPDQQRRFEAIERLGHGRGMHHGTHGGGGWRG